MNVKGIELLRKSGLPGPENEIIVRDISKIDLDNLYKDSKNGLTILIFDYLEKINQNPLYEKNVRKYGIKKQDFFKVLDDLVEKLKEKGVKRENMVFVIHESYSSKDISFSGRVAIQDKQGNKSLIVEAVRSLREGEKDFTPEFVYHCPFIRERLFYPGQEIIKQEFDFPKEYLDKIIEDALTIPGNPNIDFEIYANTGKLFYHDMFLDSKEGGVVLKPL